MSFFGYRSGLLIAQLESIDNMESIVYLSEENNRMIKENNQAIQDAGIQLMNLRMELELGQQRVIDSWEVLELKK
jgi:hypothetical protein